MVLSSSLTTRLLGAIETDSFVFLCGAGLSVGQPSNLLSAVSVAQFAMINGKPLRISTRRYEMILISSPDISTRGATSRKYSLRSFLGTILLDLPNSGHAAVADLLISRGSSRRSVCELRFDDRNLG